MNPFILFTSLLVVCAFTNPSFAAGKKKKTTEPCEIELAPNVTTAVATNTFGLPEVPTSFENIQDVRDFKSKLVRTIGENSRATVQAFHDASERADDSFDAIKRSMVLSGEDDGKSVLVLFRRFNETATRIGPPPTLNLTNAANEANNGIKATVRGFLTGPLSMVGVKLPPTFQQWLAIYSAEAPNFRQMRDQVQAALDDTYRRSQAAEKEIETLEQLIEEKKKERAALEETLELVSQRIANSNFDAETRDEMTQSMVLPITQEIANLQEFIAAHATIIAQKKVILANSDRTVNQMLRAVHIAVPVLRNSASTIDDALFYSQMADGAESLGQITTQAIVTTSALIGKTAKKTNELAAKPTIAPVDMAKSLASLVATIRDTNDAVNKELPDTLERIRAYDEFNAKVNKLIDALPVAAPTQALPPPNP